MSHCNQHTHARNVSAQIFKNLDWTGEPGEHLPFPIHPPPPSISYLSLANMYISSGELNIFIAPEFASKSVEPEQTSE